jgi:hypothetical protein
MPEDADWTAATWEGSRRRQHAAFLALPFREKVAAIEELAELAAFFAERRQSRVSRVREVVGPPSGRAGPRDGS